MSRNLTFLEGLAADRGGVVEGAGAGLNLGLPRGGGSAVVTGVSLNTGFQAVNGYYVLFRTHLEAEIFVSPVNHQIGSSVTQC